MDQLAVALENARLFGETQRRAVRLQTLYEIEQAILSAESSQGIAQAALVHVRQLVPSVAGYVALFEKDAAELIVIAADTDQPSAIQVGSRLAVQNPSELETLLRCNLISDADQILGSSLPQAITALQATGVHAYLAAPLCVQDVVIGGLVIASDQAQQFTAMHRDVLREASNQIAIALHSARLEAARRSESERLRTLIDNLPEGVLLLDPNHQKVLSNPVGSEMLTWLGTAQDGPLTQLGPHSLDVLVNADLADPLMVTLQEPGKRLEMAAYAIEPTSEENRGMLVLMRDVTELRQTQELASQRDRLAAVGRLAAGVAHDFNNNLTAITGYTNFVRDALRSDNPLDWPSGAELRADLEQVSLAANRATALTRQLLIFSRKESLEPEMLDLNALVSNMAKMIIRLIGEDVQLKLSLSQDAEWIKADPGQIEQVVMNLAVNARDAMPRGGPLTIETGHVEWKTTHKLSHSPAEPGSYVRLTVKDKGVGMTRQVIKHLFEPFFTTKAPGKGTGLGLATVYSIVQHNNGHLDVHSQLGQGTTFHAFIPRVAGQAQPVPAEPHTETIAGGSETILLVEDEDNVRDITRRILERRGYTVLAARGPDEALRLSDHYQGQIDLLLTDVVMPEMNGQEMAAQIAVHRAEIKVLFMSGYTGDIAGRYGIHESDEIRMAAKNLLQKPFENQVLTQRVRELLGEPAAEPVAAPPSTEMPLHLPGSLRALQPGQQVCFIYQDGVQHLPEVASFIRQGLEQQHKALALGSVDSAQRLAKHLEQIGVNLDVLLASGQLSFWPGQTGVEAPDRLSPDLLIALLCAETEKAAAEGYASLRVTVDMAWIRQHLVDDQRLIAFQLQLHALLTEVPMVVLCQYDRREFDARGLLDVLRAHPLVWINTHIYDNIYYVDPSQCLSSDQIETTLERWLTNLESRSQTEAAIRQSEYKLRSFIEQSDDAIVLTDEQGRIVEWNRGAERVYGIERAQTLGRYLWDVQFQVVVEESKNPDTYTALKKMLQEALHSGWSPYLNALREVEIQRSDGARRMIQMLSFVIQTDLGIVLASTSRDVTERKRAEESLLKSEARYRALVEHIPAIIYETPFGEATPSFYAGPQIERILGFTQTEWTESSKLWLKQIHPDDRVRVLSALTQSHDSGQPFSAEYRLISRNGRPVWFYDEAMVVRDEEDNPLFLHGIMLEIDERKQAEQNLHRYAMHLALLNELGQQIAAELEVERLLTQAVYLVHASFGYHHVGLFILDQERNELVMRACAGSYVSLFSSQLRLRVGKGMIGWVGLQGERLLANDVRQDERYYNPFPELISTQSELAVPIRTGGELVGVLDVQSPDLNAFDQDDVLVLETLADQIAVAIKNARLYAALARERISLAQRVEERTAELSLANAELARAARLKDEFLANMSHELRTPLNAILGLSEAVLEGVYGPLTERQHKSLHSIGEAGHHLLTLVNDILDIAKAEAGKLELQMGTVAIRDLCQSSLNLVRQMAHKKGIQVLLVIDEQVVSIHADQRRLKQVLVNLLSNAVKFTPQDGKVGLEVVGNQEHGVVNLTVWDSGVGIAKEDLERLFQPFVQLDGGLSRQYAGTGLGLAMVRRLVELHGGGVSVESQIGEGSRFTVSLPWVVSAEPSEAEVTLPPNDVQATPPVDIKPGAKAPLVLLAEDNPVNVNVFQDYLRTKGYRIAVACNGSEAIELAHQQQPDLILMDIQMPEMDGLTAIRRLRSDNDLAKVPIIALTALAMPGDRERCLDAGANDYLSKPVSIRQLLKAIAVQLAVDDVG
jgi:PAS domain S-box-containing protein